MNRTKVQNILASFNWSHISWYKYMLEFYNKYQAIHRFSKRIYKPELLEDFQNFQTS